MWSLGCLAHASTTPPRETQEQLIGLGLVESLDTVRGNSHVVDSTNLWAPKATEVDEYVSVQLREELPLVGPDWDDGATIGELQAWVASALLQAAPLLSPSRTQVELQLLVPFELSLAKPGHEHASCSTESATAAKLPLPFALPVGSSLLESFERSEDDQGSLLDAATQGPPGPAATSGLTHTAQKKTADDDWQHLTRVGTTAGYAPSLAARVFDVVRESACGKHSMREDTEIRDATPRVSCETEDSMHMPSFIAERMRWQGERPSISESQFSEQCEPLRFSVSFQPDASLRADHEALIFNSAGVLRSALTELRRLGSCCHELHSSSVSNPVLFAVVNAVEPFHQATATEALRTRRQSELLGTLHAALAALPAQRARRAHLPPPSPPPPLPVELAAWGAWTVEPPCSTAKSSCVLAAAAVVTPSMLDHAELEGGLRRLPWQLAHDIRESFPEHATCNKVQMRLLLPITVAVLSQGSASGADQAARGAALQAAIERTACSHLAARRATATSQPALVSSAEECLVRLATAMPLGAHVELGDLQLSPLLPGLRRGADGTYMACNVADHAAAHTSSGSENAARLTDRALDSRWESAPVASNRTAWVSIDLGSEQVLKLTLALSLSPSLNLSRSPSFSPSFSPAHLCLSALASASASQPQL